VAAKDQKARRLSSTVAAITRHRGDQDPTLPELRRDLRAAGLEDYIRRVVGAAPPLTADQRDRLATLLRGSGGETA